MPTKIEKDVYTGQDTTGHEWDGIKELNTPLPTWWLYTFYACIAVSVVMWVLLPSWPLWSTYWGGLLGYNQRVAVTRAVEDARAAQGVFLQRISAAEPAEILRDPQLLPFALQGGAAAFADNCAPCHGQGGAGQRGVYPALVDDDWLWGGRIADIYQTIRHGIRNGGDEARLSEMPSYRDMLSPTEVDEVAEAVLALSGRATDEAKAAAGAPLFADNCAACHGAEGEGNTELGAPRLNDSVWLYGGDRRAIVAQILLPRHGVMPAFAGRLSPETIKMLAVYVHSLGGGVSEPATAGLPGVRADVRPAAR